MYVDVRYESLYDVVVCHKHAILLLFGEEMYVELELICFLLNILHLLTRDLEIANGVEASLFTDRNLTISLWKFPFLQIISNPICFSRFRIFVLDAIYKDILLSYC
ncbi:Oxygen-dependent coproporphyrinogen-III oxidase [Dirofilaria immitis]